MTKISGDVWDAVVLNPVDELATALRHIKAGEVVRFRVGPDTRELSMQTNVPICHKFAIRDVASGEPVRKYGEVIAAASQPIAAGAHAHVHNIKTLRAIKR